MNDEDREWLEAAMKQHTFDDADKLKEICEEMADEIKNEFKIEQGAKQGNALYDMLDRLDELIDIHERNSLNMAICGGLQSLLKYCISHPDKEARKMSCSTFSSIV